MDKHVDLVPNGNLLQRLQAAIFLVRHPNEFLEGIISEFVVRAMRQHREDAQAAAHRETCGEQHPVLRTPELDEAAAVAAQEAVNG